MRRVAPFSADHIKELNAFIHEKGRTVAESHRGQALLMLHNEYGADAIKMLVNYEKKYVFRIRKAYLEKGINALLDRPKKSRPLLTRGQIKQVAEILHATTPRAFGIQCDFWTTNILARLIKEQYGVMYKSKTSIRLLFKKADFTYHKPDKQYKKHDRKVIDEWREEVLPFIKQAFEDPDTVILTGDEMILTTQTTTQTIWLPRGSFPKIDVASNRQKRCIYGFLDVKTGIEHSYVTKQTTGDITCKMLEKLANIYHEKKIVLVWDNASWHKSQFVRDFLTTTKHSFHLINFPPYAPEENPQEHVWKEGRSEVTHNKFIENIDKASNEFVDYLNNTKFDYNFLGLSGLVKC